MMTENNGEKFASERDFLFFEMIRFALRLHHQLLTEQTGHSFSFYSSNSRFRTKILNKSASIYHYDDILQHWVDDFITVCIWEDISKFRCWNVYKLNMSGWRPSSLIINVLMKLVFLGVYYTFSLCTVCVYCDFSYSVSFKVNHKHAWVFSKTLLHCLSFQMTEIDILNSVQKLLISLAQVFFSQISLVFQEFLYLKYELFQSSLLTHMPDKFHGWLFRLFYVFSCFFFP